MCMNKDKVKIDDDIDIIINSTHKLNLKKPLPRLPSTPPPLPPRPKPTHLHSHNGYHSNSNEIIFPIPQILGTPINYNRNFHSLPNTPSNNSLNGSPNKSIYPTSPTQSPLQHQW